MANTYYTSYDPAFLTTPNNTWTTALTLSVPETCVEQMEVVVFARDPNGSDCKTWRKLVGVRRDSGNAVVVGSVLDLVSPIGTLGAALWDVSIAASGNDLVIQVKGKASADVDWGVIAEGRIFLEL